MSESGASKSRRLFFALEPPQNVREAIGIAAARFASDDGRVIQAANFHLTLAFLGQVAQSRLGQANAAAEKIVAEGFTLRLDTVQSWSQSGILYLTTRAPPSALQQLAQDLRVALGSCGFELEAREFRPHVTLARKFFKSQPPQAVDPIVWQVADFVLMESQQARGGSLYTVLGRRSLGTANISSIA